MSKRIKKIVTQLSLRQKVVISAAVIGLIIITLIVQSQTGLRGPFKREANNFLIPFKEIMPDLWLIYDSSPTDEEEISLIQMEESLERMRKIAKTNDEKQMLVAYEDIYKKLQDLYRDAEIPELNGTEVIMRVEFLQLYDRSFDLF